MNVELTPEQVRVLGCLMEKSVTTPDQYPLTLNALTNACNQKTSREPVMSLDQGTVQRVARQLQDKHLLAADEQFKSRVEKYTQRLCNTPFAEFELDAAEFAVLTVLMLRGPQTPGELRTRCNRMHAFADNAAVSEVLKRMMAREGGPLVARLPRVPGRQDHEYAHLLAGSIESAPLEVADAAGAPRRGDRLAALEARVAALETALVDLAGRLGETLDIEPAPAAADAPQDAPGDTPQGWQSH